MERKLRFLTEEIHISAIEVTAPKQLESETINTLERQIEEKDSEVKELNHQLELLLEEKNRTREHFEVLARDLKHFGRRNRGGWPGSGRPCTASRRGCQRKGPHIRASRIPCNARACFPAHR